jgi:hypothetical protein
MIESSFGGDRFLASDASSRARSFKIFFITRWFSMEAMIFALPPHFSHFSIGPRSDQWRTRA